MVDFNFKATASFNFLGRSYSFVIKKWMGYGFTPFMSTMLREYNNGVFGTLDAVGTPTQTTEQRNAALTQAVRDVFLHLNQILRTHQRGVLEYAIWYRENRKSTDTYAQYIQLITCHCIAHSDFMHGLVRWEEIPFVMGALPDPPRNNLLENVGEMAPEPARQRQRVEIQENID
jgi:hypothetical protein